MRELKTPRGLMVRVPETQKEDPSPSFDLSEKEAIARYYPKDLAMLFNRLVMMVESHMPWLLYPLKKLAVKSVVAKKNW